MTEQTDRELLEMAAKAVGLPWERWVEEGNDSWNPLTDDGDALWLAVAINQLDLVLLVGKMVAAGAGAGTTGIVAVRRAITYAAASIWEAMP